jgi:Ca-activated chloride channel homolog
MKLNLTSDYRVIDETGGIVHVLAELQAPKLEISENQERAPLNLALVIDASGSMGGAPLESAKQASQMVVENLRPADRISVVSFSNDVITHVNAIPCDEHGKRSAQEQIGALHTRGMTNLSEGWLTGARCVAKVMEELNGYKNHVVLLSDGHANEGVTDPRALAEQAAELRQRNLFTSTVGIGDSYSPVQLQAIAESGGGSMHDAERPEEIIEVVLAELGDLRQTVVENIELSVQIPDDVNVECLGLYPAKQVENALKISMGSIISEGMRTVLLRLRIPQGLPGEESIIKVSADWNRPGEASRVLGGLRTSCVTRGNFMEQLSRERDEKAATLIAELWQSWLVRRAMDAHQEERFDAASELVQVELASFESYVAELTDGQRLIQELRRFVQEVRHDWSPRAAKEVMLHHSKACYFQADHRSDKREDWTEFIGRK